MANRILKKPRRKEERPKKKLERNNSTMSFLFKLCFVYFMLSISPVFWHTHTRTHFHTGKLWTTQRRHSAFLATSFKTIIICGPIHLCHILFDWLLGSRNALCFVLVWPVWQCNYTVSIHTLCEWKICLGSIKMDSLAKDKSNWCGKPQAENGVKPCRHASCT